MSTTDRELPTPEAAELIGLTRELVAGEVAPRAAADEEAGRFPREVFRTLGRAGLLGLAYPEEYGGGAQPYEVYLQVLEELAAGWLAVGLGVTMTPGLMLKAHRVAGTQASELPGDFRRRVYVATYGEPPHPPATKAFVEAVVEAAARARAADVRGDPATRA